MQTDDDTLIDPVTLNETSLGSDEQTTEDKEESDIPTIDKNRRKAIIPPSHQPQPFDNKKFPDVEMDNSENEDESSFDIFILRNFTLFSGQENVSDWLDTTEKTFNNLKVSRNLRFAAIPLLVEGDAKRKYIRNRNEIKSFDDFYEFLLINFDNTDFNTLDNETYPLTRNFFQSNRTQILSTQKSISFEDQHKATNNSFDLADNLPPRPILRSTALVDMEATGITGGYSARRSTLAPLEHTYSGNAIVDGTTHVLRKAILDNLIKNPKTFQGGKDDVKQWLEDLESLFNLAQIPDVHKLHLVPYSLRGEALRWYKNNKSTLISWQTFVRELKEAFLSPFCEEVAFKKLESYSQGINQSIRSFYNEVLKLCTDTDPTMSDSTKLRNLLTKAKPTIQFEIRRKKPTTTKQFFEYAKEIEDLLHLSNIDTTTDNANHTLANQIISTETHVNVAPSNTNSSILPVSNRRTSNNNYNNSNRNYNHNYNTDNANYNKYNNNNYNSVDTDYHKYDNSHTNNYRSRFPQEFVSSNSSFRQNTPSFSSTPPVRPFSQFNSNKQRPNFNHRYNPSGNQPRPLFPYNNNNRQHHANSIAATDIPISTESAPPSLFSEFCTQCNEAGHKASACPRF